jgi:hypothetical protein
MLETYVIILAIIGTVSITDKIGGLILRLAREVLEE